MRKSRWDKELLLILAFAVLLVYAILLFEFKSFRTAGIILLGYSAYQAIGVSLAVDVILSRMNGTGYSPSLYRLVSS